MKRRTAIGRNATKALRSKPLRAPKAKLSSTPSIADLQAHVRTLTRQLGEALEQQTATAEVLKIISSSPGELEPVFQAMLTNAVRICEASFGVLFRYEDEAWRAAAMFGVPLAFAEYWQRGPQRPGPRTALGRVATTKQTVHIADVTVEPAYVDGEPIFVAAVNLGRFRTILNVPMLREDELVGCFAIYRQEVLPFTDKQVALVQNFAAQAVIAIENTRLLGELRESLQQQTATADVLKVISSSPGELEPVFQAMLENATRICEANVGNLFLREGDDFRAVAVHGVSDYAEWFRREPMAGSVLGSPLERVTKTKKILHIHDLRQDQSYLDGHPRIVSLVDTAGARTHIVVPLLKESEVMGVIVIYRQEVRPFTDQQIDLLANFAAQAVIAIENARLLSELRQRTDDLTESLEQQTATSEVLKVISSSPGDLQPVFQAMLENATRVCDAAFGTLYLREADGFRTAALHNVTTAYAEARRSDTLLRPPPGTPLGEVARTKQVTHTADLRALQAYIDRHPFIVTAVELGGYRTAVCVPMVKNDELIGAITVSRTEVRPFSDKQIALLTNFAAQAVIAIENARLLSELRQRTDDLTESLEQQTATSEVLKVISSSPTDIQPVFETIAANALQLCEATWSVVVRFDGKTIELAALHNLSNAAGAEAVRRVYPRPPQHGGATDRAILTRAVAYIADVRDDSEYPYQDVAQAAGYRSHLSVPILRHGQPVGAITVAGAAPRAFSERQVTLLQTFADQAVIALENARLFNDLRARTDDLSEALEQQTATSEVLEVISRAAFDLQPVFDTIAEHAVKLCDAERGYIFRFDGALLRAVADYNAGTENRDWVYNNPIQPGRHSISARAAMEQRTIHVPDVQADPEYSYAMRDVDPIRTTLAVPMLKDNVLVGTITIYRLEVKPFTEKQIALVETFAAQAVIAIENVRLLGELRESLQQQTATADVLKVISRSTFDLQTVLNTLSESAARLCDAEHAWLFRRVGDTYQWAASYGHSSENHERIKIHMLTRRLSPGRGSVVGRAVLEGRPVQIVDVLADPEYEEAESQKLARFRTTFAAPLLRQGEPIGAIALQRTVVKPFTEKQIELVQIFADQAVIAIENARLLGELRESLQQQTATADVLKVISRSTFDLQTVLDALVQSAARLCQADKANIARLIDDGFQFVAFSGFQGAYREYMTGLRISSIDRGSITGRAALEGRTVHIPDVLADPEFTWLEAQKRGGYRTALGVPLMREGTPIGVFFLTRPTVDPFTLQQIELVQTFADQAVIAIENVRLFEEVQQRTADLSESLAQQTATADVLKVISRSTFDLRTVLQTLVESAAHLCEADKATITRMKDGVLYRAEAYGFSQEFMDYVKDIPIEAERGSATGRALLEGRVIHIADVQADPEYTLVEAQRLGDFRTILCVPMMREGVPIGVLALTRSEVRPFTEKQIELVSTFADQAAIAIENVRLFESVEARTRELVKSLEDLRTAQDRLVQTQKLASLGQLTAGIAHEIKNPLNFVNNFSSISIELIDELQEALQRTQSDDKIRSEIAELTDTLRGNLDKIVQHGKRADSIVKNMLLHSREGSGEHRPANINAIVEESLNLAYHGARAEKQGFNIILERSFDPTAGEIDLFPQEITRVLLNLISNGFYAAAKRKAEAGDGSYEPTLVATTKNLGDRVEIKIRDNGTGIPTEVKEKMFNPFFTTKPAGEGTGLGLSLSHDIVVKQHSGSIEVDTQPGEFTEFKITLPRTAASIAKSGGRG